MTNGDGDIQMVLQSNLYHGSPKFLTPTPGDADQRRDDTDFHTSCVAFESDDPVKYRLEFDGEHGWRVVGTTRAR